jgi:hypothetical protein
MSAVFQSAMPNDDAPDCGSKHRGGSAVFLFSLLGLAFAVGLLIGAIENLSSEGFLPCALGALPVWSLTAWGWWCWLEARGPKNKNLPVCRGLLRKDLNFLVQRTMMDVAITAFFRPEQVGPGHSTCLLVFLENYASRQRHATLYLPANKAFGLPHSRKLRLAIAPGQAAVYRLPLRLSSQVRTGEFELKIRAIIKTVTGLGCLLPTYAGQKNRAPTTIGSIRFFLRPSLSIRESAPLQNLSSEPLAPEAYLSLFVPGLAQPRFELLGMISEYPPTREIVPSPGL